METNTFIRKPLTVQAVQVTDDNLYDVAKWCGGDVHTANGKKHIQVNVLHPLHQKQSRAGVGDWVLKSAQGFKIYADTAFTKGFEVAGGIEKPNFDDRPTQDAPVADPAFIEPPATDPDMV